MSSTFAPYRMRLLRERCWHSVAIVLSLPAVQRGEVPKRFNWDCFRLLVGHLSSCEPAPGNQVCFLPGPSFFTLLLSSLAPFRKEHHKTDVKLALPHSKTFYRSLVTLGVPGPLAWQVSLFRSGVLHWEFWIPFTPYFHLLHRVSAHCYSVVFCL